MESDTNFYYLQSRYYDPEVGRFINADNFEYINSGIYSLFATNLYCYCNADPVNDSDPNGTFSLKAIKSLFKRCAKWLCKVNRFAKVIDILLTVIPMGATVYNSVKAVRNAKKFMVADIKKRSKKIIVGWVENTLSPAIKKYVSSSIYSAMLGFATNLASIALTIWDTSLGKIIARGIDKVDSKKNNGYCFY